MHTTLQRQIIKHLGSIDVITKDQSLANFVEAISNTYENYDEDRKMIEHALELSSKELNEQNSRLQVELEKSKQQRDEFEKINKFMTGRENKMMELKQEIANLKAQLAVGTTEAAQQTQSSGQGTQFSENQSVNS